MQIANGRISVNRFDSFIWRVSFSDAIDDVRMTHKGTKALIPLIRDPREALKAHFGFSEFLSGQERVVSSLLARRDTLAVMPTGGGKSLCYQLPAMVMDGVTLVVSPLIALMKDQVDGLVKKGVPATVINSTLTLSEQTDRLNRLADGEFKLVYVAPERFRSAAFIRSLSQVHISLFAVDEAHCLSQWGHDFRPDYLRLSEALQKLGSPQTAAFTATATPEVRSDILQVLRLREPFVSVSGFERPNLSLNITHCGGNREKYEILEELIEERKTGIVYCSTRKKVEEVSTSLAALGKKVVAYHGGMDDKDRTWAQNAFLDRSRDVAVATNAFGMGIDRSDVRFVAHFDVPGSVEAYYQEAGRAGRDGEPARCDLLFNYADTRTQEFFIEGNNPSYEVIVDLYRALRQFSGMEGEISMGIKDLAGAINVKNTMQVSSAISHLVRARHIDRFDIPGQRIRGTRLVNEALEPEDLEIDREALAEKEERDRAKLDAMIRFCYDETTCRQAWILNYFGEKDGANCGTCDNCIGGWAGERREATDEEFLAVRKALSGVARASKRLGNGEWEPRFGKGKIVQMLMGSRSKDLVSSRLDQLSTFGLMKDLGSAYVFALLEQLENGGLLITRKTPYPLLTLTRRGSEVMKGNRDFRLEWPDRDRLVKKKSSKSSRSPSKDRKDLIELEDLAFNEELYQILEDVRKRVAKEAGGIPHYVVFSNQVLEFFTRLRPTTTEQAMRIRGVGKVKAERYLESFLEAIREFGPDQ